MKFTQKENEVLSETFETCIYDIKYENTKIEDVLKSDIDVIRDLEVLQYIVFELTNTSKDNISTFLDEIPVRENSTVYSTV